jgi:acyl-CoA synthetase (AMP-forming)/AMP-acid ligase II
MFTVDLRIVLSYPQYSTAIMAPAQIALPGAPRQLLPQSLSQTLRQDKRLPEDTSIRTVDALVRHRARLNPHAIIVSYPSAGVEFVDYSTQQLDVFAYRVARHYQNFLPTRTSSKQPPTTVAILGPSNFDYLITMLALTKLGHTVLFLSTRISQLAVESFVETTSATYMLADTRFLPLATNVSKSLPTLHVASIAGSSVFDFPVEVHADTQMDYQLDPAIEENNNIYIIHSSGMCYSILVTPYSFAGCPKKRVSQKRTWDHDMHSRFFR